MGGGVIGLSCAYHLAKSGCRTLLLERDALGSGASSGNAGTISVGHPPLNSPGRISRSLRGLFDPHNPLYVLPRWDPGLWRWLWKFARLCTREQVARYMEIMGPLGHFARDAFGRIMEEEAIECGYEERGYYDVCLTTEGLAGVEREARLMERWGYLPALLSGDDLRRTEPAFGVAVRGAAHYPEACTLDPARFLVGLAAAAERLGVVVREGETVVRVSERGGRATGVETPAGTVAADAVVLATGPYSLGLVREFGCRPSIQPGKGYHRDLSTGDAGSGPARELGVACTLHEGSVFCTPMNGRLRLAGTMEFSGENLKMRTARLEQLSLSAERYLPGLGGAKPISEWCGLRPMTADGIPIVGPVPGVERLWLATGHGMLGLTLGPATGEIVRSLVTDDRAEVGRSLSSEVVRGLGRAALR